MAQGSFNGSLKCVTAGQRNQDLTGPAKMTFTLLNNLCCMFRSKNRCNFRKHRENLEKLEK